MRMTVVKCDMCGAELPPIPVEGTGDTQSQIVSADVTNPFGHTYHADLCVCCSSLLRNVVTGRMSEEDWKFLIAHANQALGLAGNAKKEAGDDGA